MTFIQGGKADHGHPALECRPTRAELNPCVAPTILRHIGLSGTALSNILRMYRVGAFNAPSGGIFQMTVDRRRILQIALGGGSLSPLVLPERWVKPVVRSVIVPAHAAASPAATTTTTTTPKPSTDSNPNE
jgi:hypothetical protein